MKNDSVRFFGGEQTHSRLRAWGSIGLLSMLSFFLVRRVPSRFERKRFLFDLIHLLLLVLVLVLFHVLLILHFLLLLLLIKQTSMANRIDVAC